MTPYLQCTHKIAYTTVSGTGGQHAFERDREAAASAAKLTEMLADVLEASYDGNDTGEGQAARASGGGVSDSYSDDGAGAASISGSGGGGGGGGGGSGSTAATTLGAAHWMAGRAVLERLQWENAHRGAAGVTTALAILVAPGMEGLMLAVVAVVIAARPQIDKAGGGSVAAAAAAAAAGGGGGSGSGSGGRSGGGGAAAGPKCSRVKEGGRGELIAIVSGWLLRHHGKVEGMLWQIPYESYAE